MGRVLFLQKYNILIAYGRFTSARYALVYTLSIYLPTIFFSKNLAGI
jgi:hypothetical protein